MPARLAFATALMLVWMAPSARATQKLIAVLPLDVTNTNGHMRKADRASIEEMLRDAATNQLAGAGWTVMTSATTLQLLEDNGIDPTKCSDSSCQLQTARQIEADKFFTGAVEWVDGEYTASIRLIDTKSGRILAAARVLGRTTLALEDAFEKKAASFFARAGLTGGQAASPVPAAPPPADQAIVATADNIDLGAMSQVVVQFQSQPPDAVVLLDGNVLCQATPCSKLVAVGAHRVSMQREGFEPNTQQLDAQAGASLTLTLQRISARLTVETQPSGVALSIDGKAMGKSPLSPTDLAPGTHTVLVDDPCYLQSGERLTLKEGEDRDLRLTAKPRLAGLELTVVDDRGNALQGTALADGQALGSVPGAFKLPVCTTAVQVQSAGQTQTVELSLQEGRVLEKQVTFARPSPPPALAGRTFRALGREWTMQPKRMSWGEAVGYCAQLRLGGGGWRLPRKRELVLLRAAMVTSSVMSTYPGMSRWYWSATRIGLLKAWSVNFASGYPMAAQIGALRMVRCVRPGAPAPATSGSAEPPPPPSPPPAPAPASGRPPAPFTQVAPAHHDNTKLWRYLGFGVGTATILGGALLIEQGNSSDASLGTTSISPTATFGYSLLATGIVIDVVTWALTSRTTLVSPL